MRFQTSGNVISSTITNGIVVTNDSNLNQIFQNFNVFYFSQFSPNYHEIVCVCDNLQLKNALDNYSSLVSSTQFNSPVYLLSNKTFNSANASIYPNPFSDNFSIETENIISNYSLFDVTGKQIAVTNSKTELDSKTAQLNAGFYLLNLTFDNGQTSNYKLVKK